MPSAARVNTPATTIIDTKTYRREPRFPDDFVDALADGDLAHGRGACVSENPPIALFFHDGSYHAIQNECAHQWEPLHEGRIIAQRVECPLHGWRFKLSTGEYGRGGPMALDTYDVRIEAGRVWVATIPRPRPRTPTI